jgi:two-component system chemotaxis sensor kinase CheA
VWLETQGGETELDKSLLEAIKDPVTHILRNSIDHGIEVPEKRRPKGKPEEGTIHVRAFHEGGNFHLEIADDGAGIDVARVKEKALAKGQVTAAQAEKMTGNEILNLIFLPGLSTAEKVTNVSGRGVGMDVVKTNIERIGGRAKLESVANQGTTIRLEIPLTLPTIPALTVLSGKSVFAIPQAALVEMVGLDAEAAQKLIQRIEGASVFGFRNTVVPSAQANAVSSATEQVNRGLQTVAAATEEMSASIKEIAKNATEAAKVADGAMKTATEMNAIVAKLGESSAEVGQVIKVITSIAQKTDLLALNATVEAARAGEVEPGSRWWRMK